MVRTGAYAYAKWGLEASTFGGSATIDKSFGVKTAISGWTLSTNRQQLGALGQVEPAKYAYGTQSGTLSVNFVFGDKSTHELFNCYYPRTGSAGAYVYGSATNSGQGQANKTFVGKSFSTEIGFIAENAGTDQHIIRTLKGCLLNSLNITTSINDVVNCSADIAYGKEDAPSNSAGDYDGMPTDASQPFTFAHGSLKIGGNTIAEVQEVDITFNNNGDLLYQLGSNQAVTGIKRTLDITGRFKASLINDTLFREVIKQLKGSAYKEEVGGSPELELFFTNGATNPKTVKITGYGLGLADISVTGIEPVEPVFEEINWQIKAAKIDVDDT